MKLVTFVVEQPIKELLKRESLKRGGISMSQCVESLTLDNKPYEGSINMSEIAGRRDTQISMKLSDEMKEILKTNSQSWDMSMTEYIIRSIINTSPKAVKQLNKLHKKHIKKLMKKLKKEMKVLKDDII